MTTLAAIPLPLPRAGTFRAQQHGKPKCARGEGGRQGGREGGCSQVSRLGGQGSPSLPRCRRLHALSRPSSGSQQIPLEKQLSGREYYTQSGFAVRYPIPRQRETLESCNNRSICWQRAGTGLVESVCWQISKRNCFFSFFFFSEKTLLTPKAHFQHAPFRTLWSWKTELDKC